MSNLVNVVKALLGSMCDVCLFEAKNRVFEFDRCSIKWCSTHHYKILRNLNPAQLLSRDRVADFLMLSTVIITNRGCTSLVIRYSDVRLDLGP